MNNDKDLEQYMLTLLQMLSDALDKDELLWLESLDNTVQGDHHPEMFALIMNTYHKIENQKNVQ